IAVPRGRDYRLAAEAGEPYLATQTVTDYAQRDDAQHYLISAAPRATSYEILNTGAPSVFTLHESVLQGAASRRLISQTLNSMTDRLSKVCLLASWASMAFCHAATVWCSPTKCCTKPIRAARRCKRRRSCRRIWCRTALRRGRRSIHRNF